MYSVKVKCPKHPRFNPSINTMSDVKGGCEFCQDLLDFATMIKEFNEATKAKPKTNPRR